MKRDDASPQAYLASVEEPLATVLKAVRRVVRQAAPGIPEGMAYGMLDYPGLANLAAQKGYVSLYVAPAALARHREAFEGLSCGKSCLRFRGEDQVDEARLLALLDDVRRVRSQMPAIGRGFGELNV